MARTGLSQTLRYCVRRSNGVVPPASDINISLEVTAKVRNKTAVPMVFTLLSLRVLLAGDPVDYINKTTYTTQARRGGYVFLPL